MLVYGKYEYFVMHMLYDCVCVHPVAILNAAFCMACSLLMLVEDETYLIKPSLNYCIGCYAGDAISYITFSCSAGDRIPGQ